MEFRVAVGVIASMEWDRAGTSLRLNWRTARPDTPPDDTLGK